MQRLRFLRYLCVLFSAGCAGARSQNTPVSQAASGDEVGLNGRTPIEALDVAEREFNDSADEADAFVRLYEDFDAILTALRKVESGDANALAHAAVRRTQCRVIVGDPRGLEGLIDDAKEYATGIERWRRDLEILVDCAALQSGEAFSPPVANLDHLQSGICVIALDPVDPDRARELLVKLTEMEVDASSIGDYVIQRLAAAGIRTMSLEEAAQKNYGATLYVKSGCMVGDEIATYSVKLHASQHVVLEPERTLYTDGGIYVGGISMGICRKEQLKVRLFGALKDRVDRLIERIKIVNTTLEPDEAARNFPNAYDDQDDFNSQESLRKLVGDGVFVSKATFLDKFAAQHPQQLARLGLTTTHVCNQVSAVLKAHGVFTINEVGYWRRRLAGKLPVLLAPDLELASGVVGRTDFTLVSFQLSLLRSNVRVPQVADAKIVAKLNHAATAWRSLGCYPLHLLSRGVRADIDDATQYFVRMLNGTN